MDEYTDVITIDGLQKSFDEQTPVLDGLNLSVPRGAIFGFLGLNGAGKTTTIKMIAGILRPDAGTIQLFGERWSGTEAAIKARIGFVLDEPLYFDWLSGREYIEWNGRMYGLSKDESAQRTGELMEFLDLPTRDAQPIRTYSTGMKKKTSLAAAIVHKPALLVLDEPFEGIDPLAARDIRDTLLLLAAKGSSILVTSHILDTVEKLCSHLGILHNGGMALTCRMDEYRMRAAELAMHLPAESLMDLFVGLVGESTRKKPPSYV
jgi:ABC-2 type transport system ATP-binding protein